VGAGNFEEAYGDFVIEPFRSRLGHAHNVYLNFAAEAGFPGLLGIIVLMLWALMRGGVAVHLIRGTRWEWLAVGALGGTVAFCTHNLVDSLVVSGMGLILATFVGLTYALEWQLRHRAVTPRAGSP
jgi:O-antigen ligase